MMWNWVFTLLLIGSLCAHSVPVQADDFLDQVKKAALYPGPLKIFVFDYDGNIGPMKGPGSSFIRVFRWNEPNTPFYDLANTEAPEYIDIPMIDWEQGVSNTIPAYRNVPLKLLVGSYVNEGRGIRNEGNSDEDRCLTLSSNQKLNPRDYYVDPKDSYIAFRSTEGRQPLVEKTQDIIRAGNPGPMFPLYRLTTQPDLPVLTMILTLQGVKGIEWEISGQKYIASGYLAPNASVQRVFAISNPYSASVDPTSTKLFARYDTKPEDMKNVILDYLIENVLKKRIDRMHGMHPDHNVLTFIEDGLHLNTKAQQLFEEKIRGVQHMIHDEIGAPPLKIILANTAPLSSYAAPTVSRSSKPHALYADGNHLSTISVFDSKFIGMGSAFVKKFNHRNPSEIMISILQHAFNIDRKTAASVLFDGAPCRILLGGNT